MRGERRVGARGSEEGRVGARGRGGSSKEEGSRGVWEVEDGR